jgi:hypothetical protein
MTPEQFVYWLQGYTEVAGVTPTRNQWQVIKDHLQTVFHKETPHVQPYVTPLEITPDGTGISDTPTPNTYKIIC